MLNVVATSYSTWLFNRGRFVDWAKLYPLLVSSVPTALVGGLIVLDERSYRNVTGLVLLSAAIVLAFRKSHDGENDRPIPLWGAIIMGAAVGFVSGLTGVGGRAFLAPILIALRWASPRQTAALSSPFIWANLVVGLAGAIYVGQTPSAHTWQYALAALGGGHDGHDGGTALVVANDDSLFAGSNSLPGRDPTFGRLRPLSRVKHWRPLLERAPDANAVSSEDL